MMHSVTLLNKLSESVLWIYNLLFILHLHLKIFDICFIYILSVSVFEEVNRSEFFWKFKDKRILRLNTISANSLNLRTLDFGLLNSSLLK